MFQPLESLEAIVAAAARHGLTLTDPVLDTMGLDFLAVHARDPDGTRWIVRAPRRAEVAAAASIEARVLAAVRGKLPVAVPDWRIASDVIAYPRLDGTPVVTLDTGEPVWNGIDPAAPAPAFLAAIGSTLAALQRIGDPSLPARTISEERAECARVLERSRELIAPPPALLDRWQRWIDDDATWPAYVVLSHGDMHPGHLLLDENGALTGVLDWTEGRIGDPGIDLAMMHRCFGKPALEAIVDALVANGGTTWPRALEHATERVSFFPAQAADWAARANNEAILAYAKSEMERDIAVT
jgi:aminoglycoside phosphotransferase (APT) family kinase protein